MSNDPKKNRLGYEKGFLLRDASFIQADLLVRFSSNSPASFERPTSHFALDRFLEASIREGLMVFGERRFRTSAYVVFKRGFGPLGNAVTLNNEEGASTFIVPDFSLSNGSRLSSSSGVLLVPLSALKFDAQTRTVSVDPQSIHLVQIVNLRRDTGFAYCDSNHLPLESRTYLPPTTYASIPYDVRYIDYSSISKTSLGSGESPLDFNLLPSGSDGYHGSLVRVLDGDLDFVSWRKIEVGTSWSRKTEVLLHPKDEGALVSEFTRLCSIKTDLLEVSDGEAVDVSSLDEKIHAISDLLNLVRNSDKNPKYSSLFDSSLI